MLHNQLNETKMKLDIEPIHKPQTEETDKKQIEHQLIGRILPNNGHTLWKVDLKTLQVSKAEFTTVRIDLYGKTRREVIKEDNHFYVSALNKKTAIKKFKKGSNGSII